MKGNFKACGCGFYLGAKRNKRKQQHGLLMLKMFEYYLWSLSVLFALQA